MSKDLKIDFLKCSIKENQLTIKDLFSQEEIDAFFNEYAKDFVEEEKKEFSNTLLQKLKSFIDEALDDKEEVVAEEEPAEEENTSSKDPEFFIDHKGIAFLGDEKIGICKGEIVWAKDYLDYGKIISKAEALDLIAKLPKIDGKSWRLPTNEECTKLCDGSSRRNGTEAGGELMHAVRTRFESIGGNMYSGSYLTQSDWPEKGYVKVVLDLN